jgi:hypothetical protein
MILAVTGAFKRVGLDGRPACSRFALRQSLGRFLGGGLPTWEAPSEGGIIAGETGHAEPA